MNSLYLDGNYIIADDNVNGIRYTFPRTNTYYDEEKDSFMIKRVSGTNELLIPHKEVGLWEDGLGTAFSEESLRSFLRVNTDFKAALGGSSAVKVAQVQDVQSNFVDGTVVGEIAYAHYPEGTRWLPGELGGTYYPKGWYVWDGIEWNSDRDAIANQLENNILKITANETDIDTIESGLAQELLDREADDTALQLQIDDLQNNKSDIGHTHTKSEISDFNDADYATAIQGINADTAFGWGDHALVGYLTSFTETDPIFSASAAFGITAALINDWNAAFSWGDHSTQGYLTSETDPIFTASAAFGISLTDISNWNTAFGWGDHSAQGYLTSFNETDPVFQASEAANFVAGDKANLDNQSGINTGDETTTTIQTKRPLKTIEGQSLEGAGDINLDSSNVGLGNVPNIDATDRNNHTGTQPASTITGLGNVATSNDYNSLDNLPTIPPVAPVDSVNGNTGIVILDADNIDDSTTTNKFATQGELDQIVSNQNNISQEILDRQNEDNNLQIEITSNDSNINDLQNNKADKLVELNAGNGLSGGGDLSTSRLFDVNTDKSINIVSDNVELVNDEESPESSSYYGTNNLDNKGFHKLPTNLFFNAGRFYCYVNNRWVTDSDDNYGINNFQYNENCGTGTTPLIEWEHKGLLVPKGRIIKALHFGGDSNNAQVTDLELYIILRRPNPITRWETGMDADGEDQQIVIYNDLFMNPVNGGLPFSGNVNDTHLRTIEFDELVEENSYLSIYLRPVGTITATRYFRATYTWEIQ